MSLLAKAKQEVTAAERAAQAAEKKRKADEAKAKKEAEASKKDWFTRIKKLVEEADIKLKPIENPGPYNKVLGVLKKGKDVLGYFIEASEFYSMKFSDDTPEQDCRDDYVCLASRSDFEMGSNYTSREGLPYFAAKKEWERDTTMKAIERGMVEFYKAKKLV